MDRETSHLLCINVPKANIFRNNARISSRNEEKSAFHAIALLDDAFCLYISPRGDLLMRGVYVQTLLWDNALHFNQTFRSFPCVQSRSKHQRLQHKIIAANQCRNSSSVISFRRAESELFTVIRQIRHTCRFIRRPKKTVSLQEKSDRLGGSGTYRCQGPVKTQSLSE